MHRRIVIVSHRIEIRLQCLYQLLVLSLKIHVLRLVPVGIETRRRNLGLAMSRLVSREGILGLGDCTALVCRLGRLQTAGGG